MSTNLPVADSGKPRYPTILCFANEYVECRPNLDDPMVILMEMVKFSIIRVLVNQGSLTGILYWVTFEKLELPTSLLGSYASNLAGLAGKHVNVRGNIKFNTTFGEGDLAKQIKLCYCIINVPSSYNVIIKSPI